MPDPRDKSRASTGNVVPHTGQASEAPVQLPPEELRFPEMGGGDDIHSMLEARTMITSLDPDDFIQQQAAMAAAPAHELAAGEQTLPPAAEVLKPQASSVVKVPIRTTEVQVRLADKRLIMINVPDSVRAASFRVLRHRLVERGDPRTIVVTSAEAGDGKTTCAANLAIALSEFSRARVLLMEANLRSPGLAELLGMRPPVCLTRQLEAHRQQPMMHWEVSPVINPLLHVLTVDPMQFKRPRVIDGPAFELAISQLKQVGYDYIVLDTPPVLGHADVNLLQDCADGVVFAMQARTSCTKALRRAIDQLTPSKVLGTVLLEV